MNPDLSSALRLTPGELGQHLWDTGLNVADLEYDQGGHRATWKQHSPGGIAPRSWVPVQGLGRLHSGDFCWNFTIEDMGEAQIGIGFMLDWSIGPDWGFFGYLGSSTSAWAYDPSTGDVICATRSIEGGLPVLAKGHGTVSVEAYLPREAPGLARFKINGVATRAVALPEGAVLVPASCLLALGQKVTLGPLTQTDLDAPRSWRRHESLRDEEAQEGAAAPTAEPQPSSKGGFFTKLRRWLGR